MMDALKVNLINNTIVSNDTTASSGVLFNTLGAPNANTPPPTNGRRKLRSDAGSKLHQNQIVTLDASGCGVGDDAEHAEPGYHVASDGKLPRRIRVYRRHA